jgi:hypothetical protein
MAEVFFGIADIPSACGHFSTQNPLSVVLFTLE